ncbi:hypothetical protein XHV734_0127 [Xanthomonas hortorum pv. vitians]|nr:hypothetical protein XHV734_0127 [Xanthomonas hortorum pv. vitians]
MDARWVPSSRTTSRVPRCCEAAAQLSELRWPRQRSRSLYVMPIAAHMHATACGLAYGDRMQLRQVAFEQLAVPRLKQDRRQLTDAALSGDCWILFAALSSENATWTVVPSSPCPASVLPGCCCRIRA